MTAFNKISYADTGSLDAFNRLRVGSAESIFAVQCQYDNRPLLLESSGTSTGLIPTWQVNNRMVLISATSGTGTAYVQSYQYSTYQPGMSQFIAITGVLTAPISGATKEFGYFDANNGVIYRQTSGGTLAVVLRSSTSGSVLETIIPQSSWNLDTMNGNGPSDIILNVNNNFILVIDLQFLGMGRVRVGFDIDGVIYYVHQFLNANNVATTYMQTASLPIQALLTVSGTTQTASMYFKCAAVHSEGGNINFFNTSTTTPDCTITAASGTRTHIVSIRPKTTFNGITNRIPIKPLHLSIINNGANNIYWELCLGVSFTLNPSFVDINSTYSSTQYATGGTYSSLASGLTIKSGYIPCISGGANPVQSEPASVDLDIENYPLTLNRSGAVRPLGTLSLLVTGIGGTSACRASITFDEIK